MAQQRLFRRARLPPLFAVESDPVRRHAAQRRFFRAQAAEVEVVVQFQTQRRPCQFDQYRIVEAADHRNRIRDQAIPATRIGGDRSDAFAIAGREIPGGLGRHRAQRGQATQAQADAGRPPMTGEVVGEHARGGRQGIETRRGCLRADRLGDPPEAGQRTAVRIPAVDAAGAPHARRRSGQGRQWRSGEVDEHGGLPLGGTRRFRAIPASAFTGTGA